jgi:hypothetical protein
VTRSREQGTVKAGSAQVPHTAATNQQPLSSPLLSPLCAVRVVVWCPVCLWPVGGWSGGFCWPPHSSNHRGTAKGQGQEERERGGCTRPKGGGGGARCPLFRSPLVVRPPILKLALRPDLRPLGGQQDSAMPLLSQWMPRLDDELATVPMVHWRGARSDYQRRRVRDCGATSQARICRQHRGFLAWCCHSLQWLGRARFTDTVVPVCGVLHAEFEGREALQCVTPRESCASFCVCVVLLVFPVPPLSATMAQPAQPPANHTDAPQSRRAAGGKAYTLLRQLRHSASRCSILFTVRAPAFCGSN